MADTKITAMAAAAEVANADVVPLVSAGTNEKATRAQLLTGAATEIIELVASAGQLVQLRDSTGSAVVLILGTHDIVIASPGKAVNVQYDAVTPGDWNATVPVKLGDAIDRCAALLKVLNGGVGP